MLVLHAAFYEDRLHLWGESALSEDAPKSPALVKSSPYRTDVTVLRERLTEAGLRFQADRRAMGEPWFWLPTQGDAPLPSSPLIADPPKSRKAPVLAPWQLPTLTLSASDAIALLATLQDRTALAPGVAVGDDLRYWSAALRLAGGLAFRRQVLPDLVERQGEYRACWTPTFLGEDSGRLERLARAMPPAARAIGADGCVPPVNAPRDVLRTFLGWIVDDLVRQSAPLPVVQRKEKSGFNLHETWTQALRQPEGTLKLTRAENQLLVQQIRDWQRPFLRLINAPFRLCFRLEEPGMGDEGAAEDGDDLFFPDAETEWRIHYLLQAREDPSLLAPAEIVWKPKRGTDTALKALGPKAREGLLAALGQAASLCPAIEKSLKDAAPVGYALDTDGAFHFLGEEATLLEQNGFGVMLPASWTGKRRVKLATRVQAKTRFESKAGMTLDRVLDVRWEIVLGETGLTPRELLALAKLKAPLVRVRGQWVQLSATEIQAALALQKRGEGGLHWPRTVAAGAGSRKRPAVWR